MSEKDENYKINYLIFGFALYSAVLDTLASNSKCLVLAYFYILFSRTHKSLKYQRSTRSISKDMNK